MLLRGSTEMIGWPIGHVTGHRPVANWWRRLSSAIA